MSNITDSLDNLIPRDCETYNVGHDATLLQAGRAIFDELEQNGKIVATHNFRGIDYRWAFGISGDDSTEYIANNLSPELAEVFMRDVIGYLGLADLSVNEIKLERLGPNSYADDIHLKRSRFGEIISTKPDDMPSDYDIFYSQLHHTDKTFQLNNYKLLVYLNDIEEQQGGLIVIDPILSPRWINDKCVLIEEGVTIPADQLSEKEITGPAGTTASFSSHILHRANLPKHGFRECLHLSFHLPGEQYVHPPYSRNHFINKQ